MINTRKTIFYTLKKRIRELTKHAQLAPLEFKKIMLAVILNDLKEWAEYIPKDDPDAIVRLLENYLINNCFIINRMQNKDNLAYVNVNTPQTNNTWARIWDRGCSNTPEPILAEVSCTPWEPDPMCETKLIYFYTPSGKTLKTYLEETYGVYGQKLKTICDKMNVYIDRETGKAWYLDPTDCTWKPVANSQAGEWTEEEIINTVKENLNIKHKPATVEGIYSELSEESAPIDFCTNQEVEDLI